MSIFRAQRSYVDRRTLLGACREQVMASVRQEAWIVVPNLFPRRIELALRDGLTAGVGHPQQRALSADEQDALWTRRHVATRLIHENLRVSPGHGHFLNIVHGHEHDVPTVV